MASISFTCTDEEKELIKKIAGTTAYKSMNKYCHHIIMSATKAVDHALNGVEYDDVYPIKREENGDVRTEFLV